MNDDRVTETTITPAPVQPQHTTTIIERRGSGGGLLVGLAVLLAVAIAGFYLFTQKSADARKDQAVSDAAKSVGDAADKIGSSAEKAVEKLQ